MSRRGVEAGQPLRKDKSLIDKLIKFLGNPFHITFLTIFASTIAAVVLRHALILRECSSKIHYMPAM